MPELPAFLEGEFRCKVDARHRLALPQALGEPLTASGGPYVLAKERLGCASLWNAAVWESTVNLKVELAKQKVRGGLWNHRIEQAQLFGRLLSTRHERVVIDTKYRLVVPEGFREFLGLGEPATKSPDEGGETECHLTVLGAAVCIELWHPRAWLKYLARRMPKFRQLIEELS
jgi:MraZ protein